MTCLSIGTCLLRLEESTLCPALCWSVLEGWKTRRQVLKIASLETGLPGLPLFLLTHLSLRDPKLLFNLAWEGGITKCLFHRLFLTDEMSPCLNTPLLLLQVQQMPVIYPWLWLREELRAARTRRWTTPHTEALHWQSIRQSMKEYFRKTAWMSHCV